ncbi:MAG: glycosyltransferase [Dysgonamonadaceae bacterium]|jgi:glycosyltransferase involved in cell wall biosynthesis|nr:glycosyltransferase [Dysgonamonadaceae bacterium]
MKKILHIPNYYLPHIGGIEDVCHSIISGTQAYNHQVICFNDRKFTEKDFYEGVEIMRCGVWKKLFSQSLSFSYFHELKKIFRKFKPDIVHFHTPNPLGSVYLLLLLPKNVRLIVHWHSDIIEQGLLHVFYAPIEKRLLKRADKIVATSPTYIPGSKPLLPWSDKLIVIPNTVDERKLRKRVGDDEKIAAIKRFYAGKKIIFTFGRHVPYKGFRYLIEAAPFIASGAVVVIAGKGPLSKQLEQSAMISSLYFIGRLSEDTLRHYLYAADIFVFPSITRNEAFGIALAEAMYCGLPAVTFTIPDSGVNWVCPNGETGLECENANATALAEAINTLLSDTDLRQKLGANAIRRVKEKFTTSAIRPELAELYDC